MSIRLLITFFMTFTCIADEFKHFELGANFYQIQNNLQKNESVNDPLDPDDIRNFSSIYDQILNSYGSTYDLIGTRLANEARTGFFGGLNMIGWQHAGEFSTFKVSFNRSIAPSLFQEDKYLVNDEVIIEVDAARFLKKLTDEDIIRVSEQNLLAFAGLVFRRKMRFNHFADSMEDGLQTRFDRLFFMFKYFRGNGLEKLSPYDFLSKEDSFTLNAGAMATAPIASYGAIGAGALYAYEKKSKVTIQKLGDLDEKRPDENLRLSIEDENLSKIGANITLLLDFFQILKFTLFQYEFEYSYSKTYKTYLSLFHSDLEDSEKMSQVKDILKFKNFNHVLFANNITSKEKRQKEIMKSRYLAFIFGGVKDSQTESIEIVKDGKLHKFFKHNYEKLKYKENLFSKILTAVLGKLIGYDQMAARTEVDYRTVNINYEADQNLIKTKKDYNIFDKNIFTMDFGAKFRVNQKTKLNKKKIEDKMRSVITKRSKSYSKFQDVFDHADVSAPAEFVSTMTMDNKNIEYFMNIPASRVFDKFKEECNGKSKNIFKRLRSLFSGCRNKLYSSYQRFLKEWMTVNYDAHTYKLCKKKYRWKYLFRKSKRRAMISKCMELSNRKVATQMKKELPLWRFKDVANNINNYSKSINTIDFFFGPSYNRGSFSANLNDSTPYKSYYSEGSNKENIVTQFQIDNGLRSPASIDYN